MEVQIEEYMEKIRVKLGNELGNVTLTFFTKPLKCLSYKRGGMAERLNALVLKTSKGSNLSRVRIPVPPPLLFNYLALNKLML